MSTNGQTGQSSFYPESSIIDGLTHYRESHEVGFLSSITATFKRSVSEMARDVCLAITHGIGAYSLIQ